MVALAIWLVVHAVGMGLNLVTGDLAQSFLLPPDVRDWLPADHLVWFVLEVVDEVDLGAFYAPRRLDGRGGAAYDPAILLAVLVYAYCVGERSSRRIERCLHEHVAFRVAGRNLHPDHATLARFRATFAEPLAGLFSTVLALCERAGLIDLGLVAVDGTKLAANAAMASNHSIDGLGKLWETEARRILDEAAAVDAAEDAVVPAPTPRLLAERERRRERIRELLDDLETERAQAQAEIVADRDQRQHAQTEGRPRKRGRPKGSGKPPKDRQVNLTDPDSRIMKTAGGFVQGYNAQVAVTANQIVIAADVWQAPSDAELLAPTLTTMTANLARVGVHRHPSAVVADAGYWSAANAGLKVADTLLIATTQRHKLHDPHHTLTPPPPPPTPDGAPVDRCSFIELVETGQLLARDAARTCGVSDPTMSRWRQLWRRGGPNAVPKPPPNMAPITRPPLPPSDKTETRRQMEQQLRSPHGKALYKRRSGTVEPVFGQIKTNRRIDRFQRRGLTACAAEWQLITATHNLLKLWNHTTAT